MVDLTVRYFEDAVRLVQLQYCPISLTIKRY